MQICKSLGKISSNAIQNGLFSVLRATDHCDIKPVKMTYNVYQSNATDPNRPPLIIMHGLFGSKKNWKGMSKALENKTKRKIYSVDARNHGDSPHVDAHSWDHISADIAFLLQVENLESVSVMGHSMGAIAMMYFAMKYPELVERIIIVDTSPISVPKNMENLEEILCAMKNIKVSPNLSIAEGRATAECQIKNSVADKRTLNFIMMNLKKLDTGEFAWRINVGALQANFQHFRIGQNFLNVAPYTGPILFIAGKRSQYISTSEWPLIKKIVPNAEIRWVNSGHLVHIDQPEQFMNIVAEFLRYSDSGTCK